MVTDITLVCQDCGLEFVFTVGEQEFYAQKGLAQPKYCPICRGKWKAKEAWEARFKKSKS